MTTTHCQSCGVVYNVNTSAPAWEGERFCMPCFTWAVNFAVLNGGAQSSFAFPDIVRPAQWAPTQHELCFANLLNGLTPVWPTDEAWERGDYVPEWAKGME